MQKLSGVLAKGGGMLWHWCPGCNQAHAANVDDAARARWTWNGDAERPTLNPSILCFTTHDEGGNPLPAGQRRTLCHYFIKAGTIEYCADSPHALAGKTVPLPPLPDWVAS